MSEAIAWEKLPGVPDLPTGQVHIWRISLEQPTESLSDCRRDLSAEELDRADRFHFERDHRRHLISHCWLRRLLGAYLGVPASAIQFEIAAHGKPHLGGDLAGSDLKFNLAHSGEIALLGVCRGVEVGVDIEKIRTMPDMMRVAARFFSMQEQAQLAQISQDLLTRAFFKCWTSKEAFIKNLGAGLYFPLDQFDVNLDPCQPARLLRIAGDQREASRWQLVSLPVDEGYLGALAVRDVASLLVRCLVKT